MVTTRSQARLESQSHAEVPHQHGSGDEVVHEVSSDDQHGDTTHAHPRNHLSASHPRLDAVQEASAAHRVRSDGTCTALESTASKTTSVVVTSFPSSPHKRVGTVPAEEKLGRGCRVSRTSVSLDEEYLTASLYRASTSQQQRPSRLGKGGGIGAGIAARAAASATSVPAHSSTGNSSTTDGSGHPEVPHEEAFSISRRYPLRDAAKRAMESLRITLTRPNGAASVEEEAGEPKRTSKNHNADTSEQSNGLGTFHFRNHPELEAEIQHRHARKRRRLERRRRRRNAGGGRRRRNNCGSSEDEPSVSDEEDDENSSSSDSESASSSSSDDSNEDSRPQHNSQASRHDGRTSKIDINVLSPTSSTLPASPQGNSEPWARGATATTTSATTTTVRRTSGTDAVSIDSSISDASMREESVERTQEQDKRADISFSSASSDDNGDGTREFKNDAERRHAMRQARAGVHGNANLNFYIPDAVGVADAQKIRRRQLDRRYRWLLYEEEGARARGDGGTGGGASAENAGSSATTANGALGDISPLRIDDDVTFDSVGGLPEHIVTLREMVLLPLLYPDLFERLDLRPPRGVLFVGPPGTGKTLMARALANDGSRFARVSNSGNGGSPSASPQKVTFFVRKGADMLSKWVGESERQLKLLFEEAKRLQPSIIFFDEVDGLAPTRHTKTEQTQAALVATLLALLDGLEDRGQVVVIGATNRPDTLDPALRRPGRFDRELVFPLPDAAARRHILSIQLAKKALPDSAAQREALLQNLVSMTEGYSGADLGALCTEASLHRLRTALPQLYLSPQRLSVPHVIEQTRLHVRTEDFYAAAQRMQPSMRRSCAARTTDTSGFLDPYVEVLLRGTRDATLAALAPSWSLVDKVLRAGQRDCRDMATAVRALCAVPIPQPPRPCLLVLREGCTYSLPSVLTHEGDEERRATATRADEETHQCSQQRRALQLHHLALSILKGLPGLNQLTVNLAQLSWEGDAAMMAVAAWSSQAVNLESGMTAEEYLNGGGGGGGNSSSPDGFLNMAQVVRSVRQCSPCVVYLGGIDEWLTDLRDPAAEEEEEEEEEEDKMERNSNHGSEDEEANRAVSTGNASAATETKAEEVLLAGGSTSLSASQHHAAPAAPRRQPATGQREPKVKLSHRQQHRVRLFRHYMNMLADTDAILVLPCASATTCEALLGKPDAPPHSLSEETRHSPPPFHSDASYLFLTPCSTADSPASPVLLADPPQAVRLTRYPTRQQLLHPQYSIVQADIARKPLPADLQHFVDYVYRIVQMTLRLHRVPGVGGGAEEDARAATDPDRAPLPLQVDDAPLPCPLARSQRRARRRAEHARHCALWRKVEYRRLQLRHVLMKWVSQYLTLGKFKLLANADLDLSPDDPAYKAWRHHTRHHRLGLQGILEKIEDEQYVCLSQYHDDIDQLVRNVRSFFRTRAAQDQRYRLRALDLKQTCLLNLYKMNRTVIRFCEETRDVQEPAMLSDEDESEEEDNTPPRGRGKRGLLASSADGAIALANKDEDPEVLAELSRRAISFSQRPAAAARKKPKRYYGERRRRRKKKPAVLAAAAEADGNAGMAEVATVAQVGKDVLAVDAEGGKDDGSAGSQPDSDEGETHEDGNAESRDGMKTEQEDEDSVTGAPAASPSIGAAPIVSVEAWACALLSPLTYTRLYRVFKSVMRGLEVTVRELEERALHAPAPSCTPSSTMAAAHDTSGEAHAVVASLSAAAATTASPQQRQEAFLASVFRKLVSAAVAEVA